MSPYRYATHLAGCILTVLPTLAIWTSSPAVMSATVNHERRANTTLGMESTPSAAGRFGVPTGIAVDTHGTIYVLDRGNGATDYIDKLSPVGQKGASWRLPTASLRGAGIAVDLRGNVYVGLTALQQLEKFSPAGKRLALWGGGLSVLQFTVPFGTAVDVHERIYVADGDGHKVWVLSPRGKVLATWPFAIPVDVAVTPDGLAYVTTKFGVMYKVNAASGTILAKWSTVGKRRFGRFYGVATDSKSNVYAVDPANTHILKLSSQGQLLATWGKRGSRPGQFNFPDSEDAGQFAGIAVDRQGNIYISDTGNHRVQKLSPTGQVLAVWR